VKVVIVALAVWSCSGSGCGVMGPPIAPEDVGVAPLIERQQRLDRLDATEREAAEAESVPQPEGQNVDLPPLRPVGTR
jgi:hypothetical protein